MKHNGKYAIIRKRGQDPLFIEMTELDDYKGRGWRVVEQGVSMPRHDHARRKNGRWVIDRAAAKEQQFRASIDTTDMVGLIGSLLDEIEELKTRIIHLENIVQLTSEK